MKSTKHSQIKNNQNDDDSDTDVDESEMDNGGRSKRAKVSIKEGEDDDDGSDTDMGEGTDEDGSGEHDDTLEYVTRADKLQFLSNLVSKTKGRLIKVNSKEELWQEHSVNVRMMTGVKNQGQLILWHKSDEDPCWNVPIRFSLLLSKVDPPTLKKAAFPKQRLASLQVFSQSQSPIPIKVESNLDDEMQDINNETGLDGKTELEVVSTIRTYLDPDAPDDIVTEAVGAIRYGADLIPIDEFDRKGLQQGNPSSGVPMADQPRFQVLGYWRQSEVWPMAITGPSYVVSGHESIRSCTVVAALAQALQRTERVALVHLWKRKTSVLF